MHWGFTNAGTRIGMAEAMGELATPCWLALPTNDVREGRRGRCFIPSLPSFFILNLASSTNSDWHVLNSNFMLCHPIGSREVACLHAGHTSKLYMNSDETVYRRITANVCIRQEGKSKRRAGILCARKHLRADHIFRTLNFFERKNCFTCW